MTTNKASPSAFQSAGTTISNFGALLRRWRAVPRLSPLDLALDADISTRQSMRADCMLYAILLLKRQKGESSKR